MLLGIVYSSSYTKAGHVARMGDMRNTYKTLVRTPELKRPFERSRRRSENNIKIDLKEIGWEGMD
jgi:hypothetical protein